MLRIIAISIFTMMFTISFGQARQGSDGLYYDERGRLFSGTCYEYYADSVLHATLEIKKGEPDGLTKIYFENGQMEEIRSFRKGMMHGKWEKWNRQSVKIAEASYSDDKKDGKWYVWDDSGILRYDMTYSMGEKTGTWFMYDEKGALINQKEY